MDVSLVQARGMKIDEHPATASRPAAHRQDQVNLIEHQVAQPRPADAPLLRAFLNAPPLVPLVDVDLATLCGPVEHGLQGRDAEKSATQVQSTERSGPQEKDPQELDRETEPLPPFSELLSLMLDNSRFG